MSVTSYLYVLEFRNGTEIVAYHWHPESPSEAAEPHLHIGSAAARADSAVRPRELHKVHFPTGPVALEQVLRLAISEFGVAPRGADWDAVLRAQPA
ncbi:MAG TPA: hypothetical protein VMM78_06090 [Thermomicrobiales bacterium]|nr:hypothetical protein [Thermomicrobiales bacterium]